jgi:hypothetical protein
MLYDLLLYMPQQDGHSHLGGFADIFIYNLWHKMPCQEGHPHLRGLQVYIQGGAVNRGLKRFFFTVKAFISYRGLCLA